MSNLSKIIQGVIPFTGYPYIGIEEPCNLCGSTEKKTLSEYDRRLKKLRTVICLNCGLHRTDPMPTAEELGDYYRLLYRFDYQMAGKKPPKFHINRSWDHGRQRYARIAPVIASGSSVLDFGCGSGEFLAVCRENGADVTGIEPGKDYANFAREEYGLEILNDSWENIDLGDRKFQVITAFHVFEHLRDPLAAMKWLSSHISDDGVIAIAVPDLSPNPNSRRQLFEDLHFAHVFGFTPPTLELLGRKCGLEPHPDIPIQGTDIVFRKAKVSNSAEADPDYAREISTQYGNSDVVGHIFRGGWIVDAYRRAKKDISDSFRKKK